MEYIKFLKVVRSLQKENKVINQAYAIGVDMINFVDPYHTIITELIKEIYGGYGGYGDEGCEWFEWYCWENDFGNGGLTAYDSEGNPICYSHKSLWKYLEENYIKI